MVLVQPLLYLLPSLLAAGTAAAAAPHQAVGPSTVLRNVRRANGTPDHAFSQDTSSCSGYNVTSVKETANGGIQAHLKLIGDACNAFGYDYEELIVDVAYETKERLNVHLYDAQKLEYQVPEDFFPRPSASSEDFSSTSDLVFNHVASPFSFYITRRSDPSLAPIFDTRPGSFTPITDEINPPYGGVEKVNGTTAVKSVGQGGLVFEAGYLEIATAVPQGANIYGLGEVVAKSGLRRDPDATVQTMWARDAGDPEDQNVYGSHPIYFETRMVNDTSLTHGVFLLSSQGMDVILRPGVLDYRILGGSLNFYFVSGPSPISAIEQYTDITGKPAMMQAWTLGQHQCRWGYDNVTQTREVVESYKAANIPLDVMWNDIDWMDTYRNWIPAPGRFDVAEYSAFLKDLHDNNMKYIPIIDAAVSIVNNDTDVYEPYTRGHELDVYMKQPNGTEYLGTVWPGTTVFPDFFAPSTQEWWTEAHVNYSKLVGTIDGIWDDMNEPSSFSSSFILPGNPGNVVLTDGDWPEGYNSTLWGYSGNITVNGQPTFNNTPNAVDRRRQLSRRVGEGVDVNAPAYEIHNALDRLATSTVSPNATDASGKIQHFDVHNIWGTQELQHTYNALLAMNPGKRPFIVGRSTFPGAGRVAAHWLGDNYSQWKYMRYALAGALQFQQFGIPMVGADECGFNGNTDEELCGRWMQFGSFLPFARNHNTRSALSQEPYRWESVANATRTALSIRYSLLPYWYSLFACAHESGTPVIRALHWQFPNDASLFDNSDQFLVGDAILVTPVFEPNVSTVTGVLPGGSETIWRDWYTHEVLANSASHTFDAPLGHIPLAIRSSSIILSHSESKMTTYETRQQPYNLLVSLDPSSTAQGSAYFDDGESLVQEASRKVYFGAKKGKVYAWTEGAYQVESKLQQITILGVDAAPSSVKFNGQAIDASAVQYDADVQRLIVSGLDGCLSNGWELDWA